MNTILFICVNFFILFIREKYDYQLYKKEKVFQKFCTRKKGVFVLFSVVFCLVSVPVGTDLEPFSEDFHLNGVYPGDMGGFRNIQKWHYYPATRPSVVCPGTRVTGISFGTMRKNVRYQDRLRWYKQSGNEVQK